MNLSSQHNFTSLSNKEEISYILNRGKKIYTRFGLIFYLNMKDVLGKKIAILIKKNIGKAHHRNYIKRIIRHFIKSDITLLSKYNRVIFLYRFKGKVKYKDLQEEYLNKLETALKMQR